MLYQLVETGEAEEIMMHQSGHILPDRGDGLHWLRCVDCGREWAENDRGTFKRGSKVCPGKPYHVETDRLRPLLERCLALAENYIELADPGFPTAEEDACRILQEDLRREIGNW